MRIDLKKLSDDELQAAYLEVELERRRRLKVNHVAEAVTVTPEPGRAIIHAVENGNFDAALAMYLESNKGVSEADARTALQKYVK